MHLKRLLMTALVVGYSCGALANNVCPPVSLIVQKAHFTKANRFMDQYHWLLSSDNFKFDGKEWSVILINESVYNSAEEALKRGQKYFDTQVKLIEPVMDEDSPDHVSCVYSSDNDEYNLAASSPPILN